QEKDQPCFMDGIAIVKNESGRDRHRQRRKIANCTAEKRPEKKNPKDGQEAHNHNWKTQRPKVAPERHARGERDIEIQRPLIIDEIGRVIPVLSHLIAEPAVNTLVEMRRLDVQKGQSGNCCKQQNQRWNQELTLNHAKVDWSMHECIWK